MPGSPAPQVTATTQDDETVTLDFERPTVLFFYPRDSTPGCTTEARQFGAELDRFRDAGVDVYGVSTDAPADHRRFREREDLTVDLLADPGGAVADAFDVARREDGSTERTTFVLADGEVRETYTGVEPDGHARDVLDDVLEDGTVDVADAGRGV